MRKPPAEDIHELKYEGYNNFKYFSHMTQHISYPAYIKLAKENAKNMYNVSISENCEL